MAVDATTVYRAEDGHEIILKYEKLPDRKEAPYIKVDVDMGEMPKQLREKSKEKGMVMVEDMPLNLTLAMNRIMELHSDPYYDVIMPADSGIQIITADVNPQAEGEPVPSSWGGPMGEA